MRISCFLLFPSAPFQSIWWMHPLSGVTSAVRPHGTSLPLSGALAATRVLRAASFSNMFAGLRSGADKKSIDLSHPARDGPVGGAASSSGPKEEAPIKYYEDDVNLFPKKKPAAADDGGKGGNKYKFFEDMYPKHAPSKHYEYYEDQMNAAKVKLEAEPKAPVSESERLQKLHDWKQEKDGYVPPENFGWGEDWGPEPGEEGHNEFYKKNRMYMSFEEKSRLDLKAGVPVGKNESRPQEMPVQTRMKGAYHRLNEDKPQWFDTNQRGSWASHTQEDKKDYIMDARDEYMKEWLDKPGMSPEKVAKAMGDYNGTAKNQTVKPAERKPEWELAPIHAD